MSIERVLHCDGPECERHVRTAQRRPSAGFIYVTEGGSGATQHFCSWDCVLRFAATKPPLEIVLLDD